MGINNRQLSNQVNLVLASRFEAEWGVQLIIALDCRSPLAPPPLPERPDRQKLSSSNQFLDAPTPFAGRGVCGNIANTSAARCNMAVQISGIGKDCGG